MDHDREPVRRPYPWPPGRSETGARAGRVRSSHQDPGTPGRQIHRDQLRLSRLSAHPHGVADPRGGANRRRRPALFGRGRDGQRGGDLELAQQDPHPPGTWRGAAGRTDLGLRVRPAPQGLAGQYLGDLAAGRQQDRPGRGPPAAAAQRQGHGEPALSVHGPPPEPAHQGRERRGAPARAAERPQCPGAAQRDPGLPAQGGAGSANIHG